MFSKTVICKYPNCITVDQREGLSTETVAIDGNCQI